MEEKNNPTSTEVTARQRNILWFREVGVADVALVGGKNSSGIGNAGCDGDTDVGYW